MMDREGGLGKKLLRDGARETRIKTLFPAYSQPSCLPLCLKQGAHRCFEPKYDSQAGQQVIEAL